jgi:hypothetical protein
MRLKMTTLLDEAETALATLAAKHNAIAQRITKATLEHQRLAFQAYALGDREAKTRLEASAAALAAIAYEEANLDAARSEAVRRKAAAEQADARTAAAGHVKRVEALLAELVPLGAKLDEGTGIKRAGSGAPIADSDAFHYTHNPQLHIKAATLLGGLFTELCALKLGNGVSFPSHRLWDVASRQDLLRAITDAVFSGWRNRAGGLSAVERAQARAKLPTVGGRAVGE